MVKADTLLHLLANQHYLAESEAQRYLTLGWPQAEHPNNYQERTRQQQLLSDPEIRGALEWYL